MGGVRARKSRRNKIVNKTRIGQKRKKKLPKIESEILRRNWNADKTTKQNLQSMGLAFNPNKAKDLAVKDNKKEQSTDVDMRDEEEVSEVVKEFEKEATMGVKKERHIAPGEAKFLHSLSTDYGTDYKSMAKDKRNQYQHTPKQLERKCEAFFKSSYYSKYISNDTMDS